MSDGSVARSPSKERMVTSTPTHEAYTALASDVCLEPAVRASKVTPLGLREFEFDVPGVPWSNARHRAPTAANSRAGRATSRARGMHVRDRELICLPLEVYALRASHVDSDRGYYHPG